MKFSPFYVKSPKGLLSKPLKLLGMEMPGYAGKSPVGTTISSLTCLNFTIFSSDPMCKAFRLYAFGGREILVYSDAPKPHVKEGEVLILVPTPAEFAWDPTWRALSGEARPFTLILGYQFRESFFGLGQMGAS